jgi:purine-cytosine permease-like protein
MEDNKAQQKWYFKTWSLIASFFVVGPFMLPLVWTNPVFSKKTKIIISVLVLALSFILIFLLLQSLKSLDSYYQLLENEIY